MSSWTQFDAVQLVAWAVFIFWEPFQMKRSDREWYDKERENLTPRSIPGWVFPLVWMLLKTLNTATIVLFSSWLVTTDHWAWPAVFALFFANQVLSKFWTIVFFRLRQPRWALVIAVVLFATAAATWGCMWGGLDNSNLYGIPIGLFTPYLVWLVVAIVLNASWVAIPHSKSSEEQSAVRGQLTPLLPMVVRGKINHKINSHDE